MIEWTSWMPASCLPLDCFCEGDGGGLIRQPINTISNVAFLIAGGWIWKKSRNDLGRVFAAIVISIGLGSAFYHMSLSFIGQNIDVMAILLLPSLVILDNAAYELKRPIKSLAWAYVLGNFIFLGIIAFFPDFRRTMVAALCLALVLSEKRIARNRNIKLLASAIGLFAVAFLFWAPDRFQIICSNTLPPLGHAAWHLISAVATVYLFLYLESEEETEGIRQPSP